MKLHLLPKWTLRSAIVLLLVGVYFGAAKLGQLLTTLPGSITAVWPPAGINLAFVLLLGYKVWPALWLGGLIEQFLIRGITDVPIANIIAIGSTLATLLSAFLLNRLIGRNHLLNQAQNVFKFITLAGLPSPVVSATISITTLCWTGHLPWTYYIIAWCRWWIADAISILIFTPLLLTWSRAILDLSLLPKNKITQISQPLNHRKSQIQNLKLLEFAILLALLLTVGQMAFVKGLEYLLIPFLIWGVFRFGKYGATLLLLIVSAIAILCTVHGSGSFAENSYNESFFLLESFLGITAITTLILSAVIDERSEAEISLQKANDQLELRVEQRTNALSQANDALRLNEAKLKEQATELEQALYNLQQAQTQLVQTEKMSSLGQLVAGIAHEINNPVSFIYGNISHANQYIEDLLNLLKLYQHQYAATPEIQAEAEAIELDFLIEDLPKLLESMRIGAERIHQIVLSLRNFSRLDESQMKPVDIHQGIDNTLLLLQNRISSHAGHPTIEIIKEYGNLPPITCYAGQLNQVLMNIIANAIDALEEAFTNADESLKLKKGKISISTELMAQNRVLIRIRDNGYGMTEDVKKRLFDPFFTTKPVGKGTGLGLAISYQIVVEKHKGNITCVSDIGKGTEFLIEIPIQQ